MEHKRLIRGFELKELSDSGEFSGYGAVFGNVDSWNDVIEKGAFKRTLKEAKQLPAMLWQHRLDQVIGKYVNMQEDDRGLYVEGKLANTTLGKDVYELLKMKAVNGLSIGYSTVGDGYEYDEKTGVRILRDVNLWEVSLVTLPANDEARVSDVKNLLFAGELPTQREFEKFLRDAGFSQKQAKAVISQGYKAIADQRDGDFTIDEDTQESVSKLIESMRG